MSGAAALVEARGLSRVFDVSSPLVTRLINREPRRILKAVDGVDFMVAPGETLGVVGETGSGKSTLARMAVGLLPASAGRVLFDGVDIQTGAETAARRAARRRLQMIFQDPYASLNPRWRIGDIIAEPILSLGLRRDGAEGRARASKAEAQARVRELLALVGLSAADAAKHPHQFSGGQRQRIAIARALASHPDFVVCDEPTSALDVSVQAQILNLMRDLQDRFGLTYLVITHNLAVVRFMATRIGVMYLGRLIEIGETEALLERPRHPYTRMLIAAAPDLSLSGRPRTAVAGEPPNPIDPPPGCPFHPRCPYAVAICRSERPAFRDGVACHLA